MKKRRVICAVIFAVIILAAVSAIVYNSRARKESGPATAAESGESVPELYVYYKDDVVGKIAGYTMDMDGQYMRENIIPAAPDKTVKFQLKSDCKIKTVSYEIESTDDNRLIDSGSIEDLTEKDGKISFNYTASAIMQSGEEYFFKIELATDEQEKMIYYTRIMAMDEEFVSGQIKFAKQFSDDTLDESKSSELAAYLEPDSSLENDNLGQTTISSSYTMLIWSSLKPEKSTDTEICAKEFCIKDSGQAGTYTMRYQVKASNAEKVEETYNVEETITVWTCAGKQYVLAYNREVSQIWEANENNVGNAFIDLGIQSKTQQEHKESPNGQYFAFEINGDVYVMDTEKELIKSVYKLTADGEADNGRTKSRVIQVDDNGNVKYMIYGYSPSDEHAGKNGISVMSYENKRNVSTETAFIPCTAPTALLENKLSDLCYVGDGTFYIMIENTVYYANLKTKEWGILAKDLKDGCYAANSSGSVFAYNTSGGKYDSDNITVVDFSTGKKSTIDAGDGNKITVCGYTGENLVYGVGKESEANESMAFFPMYRLEIVDSNLKEIKSYSKDGVYIKNVEISDSIINIKRWKKGGDIDDDQLLDNTDGKKAVVNSSFYNDDLKLKELALAYSTALDSTVSTTFSSVGKVLFDSGVSVKSSFAQSDIECYYVYGYGKFQGAYEDEKTAQAEAKKVYGLVVNEHGEKLWVFEENYN